MLRIKKIFYWLIGIILFIFIILIFITLIKGGQVPTFIVSAKTEFVEFEAINNKLDRYVVYGAKVFDMDSAELLYDDFNGSIQIKEGTKVEINRLGLSAVSIILSRKDKTSAATLYNESSNQLDTRKSQHLEIYIDSIEHKMKMGMNHHFNIEGDINIGKLIGQLNLYEKPSIIHEGEITLIAKSYIFDDYFQSEPYELKRGDRVIFDYKLENQPESFKKGVGFVRFDDEIGMKVTYRRRSKIAKILKAGPIINDVGYTVHLTLIERLKKDKLFKWLSMLLGFLVSMAALSTFYYDTIAFMKSRKESKALSNVSLDQQLKKKRKKKKKKNV